jgi:hypothetical protein
MCATAGCPNDAKIRVKRKRVVIVPDKPNPVHVAYGAWLTLCHACDDALNRKQNQEYCAAMGLDTPAKQRAWCLKQLGRGAGMLQAEPTLREPGQDDEEVTA